MHDRTLEAYDRIVSALRGATGYVTAKQLAKKHGLSTATVYKIISLMRDNGIGVMPRHRQGYVLAEYASKQDDVYFSRRLNSQYARACIAMQVASPHILKRWKGDDQKFFTQMTSAFAVPVKMFEKNNDKLLQLTSKVL